MVIPNNIYYEFNSVIYFLEQQTSVNNSIWFDAKNVTAYKNGYKVVNDLTLKFKSNENIIILGPNGSGKSSIIDLISRELHPVEKIDSFFKLFDKELIDIWSVRKKISIVNNEIKNRIHPKLKVKDILISGLRGMYCKIYNPTENEKFKADSLTQIMSIEYISKKQFNCLSDGEKQITLIARAIINNPRILILDEPTVNLDLKSKIFLLEKIKDLNKLEVNFLCVTHDISMITEEYNRIIFLKDREIIADGKPYEIITSKNINKLFDIEIKIVRNTKNQWDVLR